MSCFEKPDPKDIMATEKFLLTLSGFFPLKNGNILYYFSRFMNCILSVLLLITITVKLILNENPIDNMNTLKVFVIHAFFVAKLTCFMFNVKYMNDLEEILKGKLFNLHKRGQYHYVKDVIDSTARIGNIYRISCILYLFSTTIIKPLLNLKTREISVSGWYGFDTRKYFFEVSIFQVFAMSVSAYNNTSIDILNTRLISMASAQFDVLMDNLRNCVPTDSDNKKLLNLKTEQQLKLCVEHHEIIIRFANYIEKIFSMGNLCQFLGSIVVIGVTGFNTTMIPLQSMEFVSTLIFLVIVLIQIALYCWYGNVLLMKNSEAIEACYECNWYLCDVKVQKIIIIMMERMKRPITLTAGSFFILSLSTLMAILRSSYSYIAVLQRMYNTD